MERGVRRLFLLVDFLRGWILQSDFCFEKFVCCLFTTFIIIALDLVCYNYSQITVLEDLFGI